MSKKNLFFPDVYQAQVHWHPAITLAQALADKGHTIKYMGIADCKSIVKPYVESSGLGNGFYTIFEKEYPLGYTKSHRHKPISERRKLIHLWNIVNGGLDKAMIDFNPDLLVSGYFTSLETLLMYYKYHLKFMLITPCMRHPDNDPGIYAIQNLVSMSEHTLRKIMKMHNSSIESGELTIYDFVKPLEAAIELILYPRELEFDNYQFDSDIDPVGSRVKFIEPCVLRSYKINQNTSWREKIPSGKLENNKIIFASAGNQIQNYKDKARHWFQEMVKMMGLQGMQEYHLAMSVGPDLIEEHWTLSSALPKNVSVYSWIPQFEVLGHCVAAYIHGELAIIKECIYKNVPFIIFPLNKDQINNALRVLHKGIAQVVYTEPIVHDELHSMFLQTTSNNWMRNKLRKMSKLFINMENSKPGIKFINEYLENLTNRYFEEW